MINIDYSSSPFDDIARLDLDLDVQYGQKSIEEDFRMYYHSRQVQLPNHLEKLYFKVKSSKCSLLIEKKSLTMQKKAFGIKRRVIFNLEHCLNLGSKPKVIDQMNNSICLIFLEPMQDNYSHLRTFQL